MRSQRLQSEMEIKISNIDPLPPSGQEIVTLEDSNSWLCKRYGVDLRMLNKWNKMGAPVLDYRLMVAWLSGRQFRD